MIKLYRIIAVSVLGIEGLMVREIINRMELAFHYITD